MMNPVEQNVIELPHENLPFFSMRIQGLRGRSNLYIDNVGFAYYQHSVPRDVR